MESVAVGARLLGRPIQFHIVAVPGGADGGRLAVRPDQEKTVTAAADLAKKEIYFHGLTTMERIEKAMLARHGNRAGPELVRETVMLLEGFRWLDKATGWFRLLPVERHGLPKAIDKALAVAGAVTAVAASQGPLAQSTAVERAAARKSAARVLPPDARHPRRGRADHLRLPADRRKSLTGVEAKLVSI